MANNPNQPKDSDLTISNDKLERLLRPQLGEIVEQVPLSATEKAEFAAKLAELDDPAKHRIRNPNQLIGQSE